MQTIRAIRDKYITRVAQSPALGAVAWVMPIFMFTGLTYLGAFIRIPLPGTPVPVTLQTLAVILSGACIGSARGSMSQALYVILGVVGLPIFSGGSSGFHVILGSTGGYLIGFVIAPIVIGIINKHKKYIFSNAITLWLGGSFIIFGFGLTNLVYVHGLTWGEALAAGFYPFIIGDILKIGIASSFLTVWRSNKARS